MPRLKRFLVASALAGCGSFAAESGPGPAVAGADGGADGSVAADASDASDAGRAGERCALGPVLALDFEDPGNLAIDSSERKNEGLATLVDGIDGVDGHGAGFNGSSLLSFPSTTSLDVTGSALTVAFWLFLPLGSGAEAGLPVQSILGKTLGGDNTADYYQYGVELESASLDLHFRVGGQSVSDLVVGTQAKVGSWFHVAFVLDAGRARAFIDGRAVAGPSPGGLSLVSHPTTPFRVGKDPFGLEPFVGNLDQLRIYDRTLSDSEIACLATR